MIFCTYFNIRIREKMLLIFAASTWSRKNPVCTKMATIFKCGLHLFDYLFVNHTATLILTKMLLYFELFFFINPLSKMDSKQFVTLPTNNRTNTNMADDFFNEKLSTCCFFSSRFQKIQKLYIQSLEKQLFILPLFSLFAVLFRYSADFSTRCTEICKSI